MLIGRGVRIVPEIQEAREILQSRSQECGTGASFERRGSYRGLSAHNYQEGISMGTAVRWDVIRPVVEDRAAAEPLLRLRIWRGKGSGVVKELGENAVAFIPYALTESHEGRRAKILEICLPGSDRPLTLPFSVESTLLRYLQKNSLQNRSSIWLVNEIYCKNRVEDGLGPTIRMEEWCVEKLTDETVLTPGDIVGIARRSLYFVQCAIYLNEGHYLSIYGANGLVVIVHLDDMKAAFQASDVYLMRAKENAHPFGLVMPENARIVEDGER